MAMAKTVLEQSANMVQTNPEWARIPRKGQTLEGMYRSQIFELVKRGEIKTAAIKEPGAARTGIRLIHIPSLRKWIERHIDTNPDAATVDAA